MRIDTGIMSMDVKSYNGPTGTSFGPWDVNLDGAPGKQGDTGSTGYTGYTGPSRN